MRTSVVIVWLCQVLFHAPLIVGAGYTSTGGILGDLSRFAVADLAVAFIWAAESYRAMSLWPAVFFHSFHNTISQWLFPSFFSAGGSEHLLGETGLLPATLYVIVGAIFYASMRWRGSSWRELAERGLNRGARP
jgi:hypothetical protein